MLPAIVQSHPALSNFLNEFRGAFRTRPQFQHFQAYVIGLLIYLGSRNLAGLSRALPDRAEASSLYRFMAHMDWDTEQVEQVRWALLNRRTRRALQAAGRKNKPLPVFLAIDDSLTEKTGQHMAGVDYHYSHSLGRTVLAHAWVTGQVVVMGQSYPVSWKLYRRRNSCEALGLEFASKPQLAQALLREFAPLPNTCTYVLTDSWYPSRDLLAVCDACGFKLISAVKSDRKFKALGHDLQVQDWAHSLPKRAFDFVTVNTVCYRLWAATGLLASGHRVQLLVNRAVGQQGWRYLISTDLALTPQTLIEYYLTRWEVENFYRVAKQSLGWADYQMRDLLAIERHVQLVMVAHAYLELARQDAQQDANPDAHITLGDIQREHQQLSRRAEIALVFDLARRGFELDSVYHRLAA
jgi:SRSO17 transposase